MENGWSLLQGLSFFFFFTFNTLFFIIAAGYILVTSYHVPLGGVVE